MLTITIGDTVSDIGKNTDCILQDKNGNYWFASNGDGAYCYDDKTLTHITDKDGLCSNFVWTIEEDTNGNLWVGTIDAGVWKFDGTNLINYTTKDGLAGNAIWKIYKDSTGEL